MPVQWIGLRCEEDDRDTHQRIVTAELFQDRPVVHHGHHHVQQDRIRWVLCCKPQPLGTGRGLSPGNAPFSGAGAIQPPIRWPSGAPLSDTLYRVTGASPRPGLTRP